MGRGLRRLQALRDRVPHGLPEHSRVPAGERGDAVQLGLGPRRLDRGPWHNALRSHMERACARLWRAWFFNIASWMVDGPHQHERKITTQLMEYHCKRPLRKSL